MNDESREIRILRTMAWERAKGELRSMLHTYYTNDNYDKFSLEVKNFIKTVEDNGLQE